MEVYRGKNSKPRDRIDEESIIYQNGFSAGQEHQKSSPETLIKLAKMGEDITTLKVGQGRVEVKLDNIINIIETHIREETEYRRKQDEYHKEFIETKADKWTEGVLRWTGGVIGVSVIGFIIWFIQNLLDKYII